MPNNADFTKLEAIHTIDIQPNGWVPLTIEYGISDDALPTYYWRVKGTQHTFTIPVIRLDFLSSGAYDKHFEKTLEFFREDYLEWIKNNANLQWVQEYREQFSKFIII